MAVLIKTKSLNGNFSDPTQTEENLKDVGPIRLPRALSREIIRYGAYFKGWCVAFGEHEPVGSNTQKNRWLIGESRVGLVLIRTTLRQVYREALLRETMPPLKLSRLGAQIGGLNFPFENGVEFQILSAIEQLLENQGDLHMFLTSHLIYGADSRILTISNQKPLSIIYRQIGTLSVEFR